MRNVLCCDFQHDGCRITGLASHPMFVDVRGDLARTPPRYRAMTSSLLRGVRFHSCHILHVFTSFDSFHPAGFDSNVFLSVFRSRITNDSSRTTQGRLVPHLRHPGRRLILRFMLLSIFVCIFVSPFYASIFSTFSSSSRHNELTSLSINPG